MDRRDRPSGAVVDSLISALPIDVLVERIDSQVLESLTRWRDIDPTSLHSLAGVLVTKAGDPSIDSAGYLRALHGFVAERITFNTLSEQHATTLPDATNIPAWDLIVDGHLVQVKEGSTAYEAVHHALERYPEIRRFATDPATALRLKAEGIDAMGVPGMDPAHISAVTSNSLQGLDALETAGALHVPLLTTVFSVCRYWERFNAGRIDGKTALKFAAVDIGAQALGSAVGLKITAIAIVATGGFAIAALPLTGAAIFGAIGLRGAITKRRSAGLRALLSGLDVKRTATERAIEVATEISREFMISRLKSIDTALRTALDELDKQWRRSTENCTLEACSDFAELYDALLSETPECMRAGIARDFDIALSVKESRRRSLALARCLCNAVDAITDPTLELSIAIGHVAARQHQRLLAIDQLARDINNRAEAFQWQANSEVAAEVAAEYLLLAERLAIITAPLISTMEAVRTEAERLGADWSRLSASNAG